MELITSKFGAESTAREVADGHDLSGKNVIVTGGGSGIGIETARVLADAGADVVIAVRNADQGRAGVEELKKTAAGNVSWRILDLANLQSVRDFAELWEGQPLNLLMNNAGVMACPLEYTIDGLETQIGTNHFGHYLLGVLLTPSLITGAQLSGSRSRLVALSSTAHRMSNIDFEDPHYRNRPYDPWQSYGQSKTANILFALSYDQKRRREGVSAYSVMPGRIFTPLMRHMSTDDKRDKGLIDSEGKPNPKMKMKTVEQGAATSIWAALAPELAGKGGIYLEDCAQAPMRSKNTPFGLESYAVDEASAERLWELSKATTGA